MSANNKFERMCVSCRKHMAKEKLLRVSKNKEGTVFVDLTYKSEGRGAYVCRNSECIRKAEKKNAFAHAFKSNVDKEIYQRLLKLHTE